MIKAGVSAKLPATVGKWKKQAGSSGPATIYENGEKYAGVGFATGADYDGMASFITLKKTKVDAGLCGSTSNEDNLVCYLKTADGVLTVSSSAMDTPLADLVSFANDLTSALGTN